MAFELFQQHLDAFVKIIKKHLGVA